MSVSLIILKLRGLKERSAKNVGPHSGHATPNANSAEMHPVRHTILLEILYSGHILWMKCERHISHFFSSMAIHELGVILLQRGGEMIFT